MSANRTQSARVGCAVILLLALVGGVILFTWYQGITSCHTDDRTPLVSLGMTTNPSQDRQFVEQSRQFAFEHNFRFDVDYDEQGGDSHVRMIGNDLEIIIRSPSNPGNYEVGFYNYDCLHPLAASDMADVVNDFKSFMSKIPNVTFTEGK